MVKVRRSPFVIAEKEIDHMKETSDSGLDFVLLEIKSVPVVVLLDKSFANVAGLRSRLGFVILMVYGNGRANVVHYGSRLCHTVTKSVMVPEVHALVFAFELGYFVCKATKEWTRRQVDLEAFLDSRTLFNVFAKMAKLLNKGSILVYALWRKVISKES